MELLWFLLIVAATLPPSQGIYHYVSEEKEIVYDYSATISATTTNLTNNYSSQSTLNGKLHLQRAETSIFVRLSTLTMKLYNGLFSEDYEVALDEIPVPAEYEDLLRIFKIDYDSQGHVTAVSTEIQELPPVRNIKKAIASVLQLDLRNKNQTEEFRSEELSIFGNATVSYAAIHTKNQTTIKKKIVTSNDCESMKDGSLTQSSEHKYVINADDVVEDVEVTELITLPSAHSKFLYVVQTLKLDSVEAISERYQLHQEFTETSLTYVMDEFTSFGGAKQYNNLGFEITASFIYNELQNLFNGQSGAIEETFQRGISIANTLRLLKSLSVDHLQKFYQRIKAWSSGNRNILDWLHQLLSYTGTQASATLISQLVLGKSIPEETAVAMLGDLPFYINVDASLTSLSPLLNLTSRCKSLQSSAILSFSNIIKKTSNGLGQEYVDELVEKLLGSHDHDSKLLYLLALLNTGRSNHILSAMKAGNENKIRLAAIWAASSMTGEVYETLWPVFCNTSEPFEIRGSAYFALMTLNLTFPNMQRVHNQIQNETYDELYYLHYRHIEKLSQTNTEASKILTFAPEPKQRGFSGYYEFEYPGGINLTVVSLKSFTWATLKFHSQMNSPYFLTVYGYGINFSCNNQHNISLAVANTDEASFQLIHGRHDQFVQISSHNVKDFKELLSLVDRRPWFINYNIHERKRLETSLGISTVAEILEPILYQIENQIEWNDEKSNVAIKRHYRIYKNLQQGLQFFNPIADLWQGVRTYDIYHEEVTLEVDARMEKDATVTVQVHTSVSDSTRRSLDALFVNEGVFYGGILSKTCETCKNLIIIE